MRTRGPPPAAATARCPGTCSPTRVCSNQIITVEDGTRGRHQMMAMAKDVHVCNVVAAPCVTRVLGSEGSCMDALQIY